MPPNLTGDQQRDDLTPAVRSIRIATTLIEQFAELLGRRSFLDAEDIGPLLGEARQLYPEIWSHLDDARTVLAERGINIVHYDTLRATEPPGSPGVLEVTEAKDKVGVYLGGGVLKSARLNGQGHQTARQACAALKAVLSWIDWEGLDRADDAEIEAMGTLGLPLRKKLLFGGIALAGTVALAALIVVYLYLRVAPEEEPSTNKFPKIELQWE